MKKTLYIVIISIVTIMCIIFGTMNHINPDNMGGIFSFQDRSGEKISEEESAGETLQTFTNVEIDADIASVTIQQGEEYGIEWSVKNATPPTYRVENDMLRVQQKQKHIHNPGSHNGKIVITVPKEAVLVDIKVEADVGNVRVADVSSMKTDITADVGNIKLTGCQLGDTTLEADVGNIKIKDCGFMDLNAEADVGSFNLSKDADLSPYTFDLKAGVGDVKVNGKTAHRKYKKAGTNGYKISVNCDVGDLTISYQ